MSISQGSKILASDVTAHINNKNNPHGITPASIGAATQTEVNELKTSVSEGKSLVAAAVTNKGVNTAANATFQTIANNINSLSVLLNDCDPTVMEEEVMLDLTGYTYWTAANYDYIYQGATLSAGYTYIILPLNGGYVGISYNQSQILSEERPIKIKPMDNNMTCFKGTIFRKAN